MYETAGCTIVKCPKVKDHFHTKDILTFQNAFRCHLQGEGGLTHTHT